MRQDEPGVEAPIHQAADDVLACTQDYLKSWEVYISKQEIMKVISAMKCALQEISEESSISSEELLFAVGSGQSASSLTISPPPRGAPFLHLWLDSILENFRRAPLK